MSSTSLQICCCQMLMVSSDQDGKIRAECKSAYKHEPTMHHEGLQTYADSWTVTMYAHQQWALLSFWQLVLPIRKEAERMRGSCNTLETPRSSMPSILERKIIDARDFSPRLPVCARIAGDDRCLTYNSPDVPASLHDAK